MSVNSRFQKALAIWLEEDNENKQWYSAAELNVMLEKVAEKHNIDWYWKSGAGLGSYLAASEGWLSKMFGLQTQEPKSPRVGKKYKFQ